MLFNFFRTTVHTYISLFFLIWPLFVCNGSKLEQQNKVMNPLCIKNNKKLRWSISNSIWLVNCNHIYAEILCNILFFFVCFLFFFLEIFKLNSAIIKHKIFIEMMFSQSKWTKKRISGEWGEKQIEKTLPNTHVLPYKNAKKRVF